MQTRLKDAEEFCSYLTVIYHDLWDANMHFHIFNGLRQSSPECKRVFEYAPWFWNCTSRAHIEGAILHLCRVYDQHSSAIHLYRLVAIVEDPDNSDIFCREAFLRRLGSRSNEHLIKAFGTPDSRKIREALQFCGSSLVENLKKLRDKVLAHRNAGVVAGKTISKFTLPYADIEKLIDEGFTILDLCGGWFDARSYTRLPASNGEKDFTRVLQKLCDCISRP